MDILIAADTRSHQGDAQSDWGKQRNHGKCPMTKRSTYDRPEVRRDGVLTEHVGDELVVFDAATNEAHALKPLAAQVFLAADGQSSMPAIARAAADALGRGVETTEVEAALDQLADAGLLVGAEAGGGVSRRTLLQVGGAAAAGVLVTSALVPALAAASPLVCDATQASQIGLLVARVTKTWGGSTSESYSFLTFGLPKGYSSGTTISKFSCDQGLNGKGCSDLRPPTGWSSSNPWVVDNNYTIDPNETCPSSASITVSPQTVSYTLPSPSYSHGVETSYYVVALYGHALGTTGQNCTGPFASGSTSNCGSIQVCQ